MTLTLNEAMTRLMLALLQSREPSAAEEEIRAHCVVGGLFRPALEALAKGDGPAIGDAEFRVRRAAMLVLEIADKPRE